jgi:hypothetical protein
MSLRADCASPRISMGNIESVMHENRVFHPAEEMVKNAAISGMEAYKALCAEAERDFTGFWAAWRASSWSGTSRSRRCSTSRTHRSTSGSPTAN